MKEPLGIVKLGAFCPVGLDAPQAVRRLGVADERQRAVEALPQRCTEPELIAACVGGRPSVLLRGHVGRRAHDRAGAREVGLGDGGFVEGLGAGRERGLVVQAGEPGTRNNLGLVLAVIVWVLVGGMMIVWTAQLRAGELAALPKLLVGLVVLLPWPLVRLVLLPLGLLRTAYYMSFLCLLRFQDDRRGGALLVGAWALLRAPQRSEAHSGPALQFLEKRLHRLKKLRGAAVVAMGLGAARRGELDAARALLESAFNLDPAACPQWALELAGEWLTVDAVAQGSWPRVSAQASAARPRSPLTRFLRACADRFVSTDEPTLVPPSNLALSLHWLRAPHRRATWPLLQRARVSQPAPPSPALASRPDEPPPELPAALRELALLLIAPVGTLTQEQVLRVCRAFDAALGSPATLRRLTERAVSLGQSGPDAALRELRAEVAAMLGARLREAALPIDQLLATPPAGQRASDQIGRASCRERVSSPV